MVQDTKKLKKGLGLRHSLTGLGRWHSLTGLGLWHSPSAAAGGGCCAVESSIRAAPPDECHDRKINIESQTVQQIGNETYVWRG